MRANRHLTDDEWTSRLLGDFERLTTWQRRWSELGLGLAAVCLVILLFTF